MYFALDPDQRRRQDAVRSFALSHSTETQVRALMATESRYDPATWQRLTAEVGGTTLGADAHTVDTVAVLEVLGAFLFCGPYLSSVLAVHLLRAVAPTDPARALLSAIAAGQTIAVLAQPQDGDRLEVEAGLDSLALSGMIRTVLDGAIADVLFVAGPDSTWYEVSGTATGLERTALPTLDQTRALATLSFSAVPARALTLRTPAAELLRRLDQLQQIAVAADHVGVARHSLNAGVDYAKRRSQFGRPIGAFQAVQHAFADAALAVECAWAATYEAAWEFDHRPENAACSAALAASCAAEAALDIAELTLQVCGGVGFTWDNPAHLYLKRAKSNRLLWGGPDAHRGQLAELLSL